MPFEVDPNKFPQDFSGQLMPQGFWPEVVVNPDTGERKPKWTHDNVFIRLENGEVIETSIRNLIATTYGEGAELAGLNFVKASVGFQFFLGMSPESVPGNQFAGILYHERAGGGSTLVVVAQKPDGSYLVALLDQERPMMDQSGETVLQIIGGYPVEEAGPPDQVHTATSVSEGESELLGTKFPITTESLVNLYSPWNANNGFVVTGLDQGIAKQLLEIPFELLTPQGNGTYMLHRDSAEVTDRKLERIYSEVFYDLTPELLRKLHRPDSGDAACAKTVIAITRAYMFLVLGI